MKKIKEIYSQPQCETLVVRFEGNIMSPNQVRSNSASSGYDEEYELGTI